MIGPPTADLLARAFFGTAERFAVVRHHLRRDDRVVLRLDQQRVSLELRAREERAIVPRRRVEQAEGLEPLRLAQLVLGHRPLRVLVQGWRAQHEPAHRSMRRQDRAQVPAVAAADHGDRRASK